MDDAPLPHIPVLLSEVVDALAPALSPGATMLDGTLGAGGHAARLIPRILPGGRYLGMDRDPVAHALARARLEAQGLAGALVPIVGRFGDLKTIVGAHAPAGVAAILLDVGVSSMQLDQPARGFSFGGRSGQARARAGGGGEDAHAVVEEEADEAEAGGSADAEPAARGDAPGERLRDARPLDMRMGPDAPESAAELLARIQEEELADLIYHFGEERLSRRIARAIIAARQVHALTRTDQLAAIIERAVPRNYERGRIHPATRTFQALRIAVNDELGELDRALAGIPDALAPGGRAAVISFHSLEDRRVKLAFREHASAGRLTLVTRKPVGCTPAEAQANRRARSAKLRVVERPLVIAADASPTGWTRKKRRRPHAEP